MSDPRCDLISNLPDSLLIHTLSFLPTKDAVSTCILSKRWTSLWPHLSTLHFNDSSFKSRRFFLQFVDPSLLLVNLDKVHTFVFKCSHFNVTHLKLYVWLKALFKYNSIAHLELRLDFETQVSLPSSLFMCNTITVLKLTSVRLSSLPRGDFPALIKLRVLHLDSVEFQTSQCLQWLLSRCPYLEELDVTCLDEEFPMHIERFDHLRLAAVDHFLFSLEAFSNVQFLTLTGDEWCPPLDLPTFPNLIHLEIDVLGDNKTIVCLLHSFPKLHSLVICTNAHLCGHKDEEGYMEMARTQIPPCISSHLQELAFTYFSGHNFEFEFVRFIMENASVLRTFIIHCDKDLLRRDRSDGLNICLQKLLSYPRISTKCRVLFDTYKHAGFNKFLTIRKSSVVPSY